MTGPPTLGILMLETRFPRPPGDIGHAATFPFPVRRVVVHGATPMRVVRGDDPALVSPLVSSPAPPPVPPFIAPFVAAGHRLIEDGCTAIATSCGFLARWQQVLQAALPVPVWSSALLWLPALAPRRCGVITIDAASLTPAHFTAVGAYPDTPVEGITPGSSLHRTLLGDLPVLDAADAQAQVLAASARLCAREPGLDALVLECTNLPPYAPLLAQASGLPVFDIVSLLCTRMGARERSEPFMNGSSRLSHRR